MTITYTHKTTAPDGLWLRLGPTTNYPKIGLMPLGTPLNVTSTVSGWHKISLAQNLSLTGKVNGSPLSQLAIPYAPEYGYCSAQFTEPWGLPPPQPSRNPYRIGVHTLGNWRAADQALAAGAPVIVGMFGKAEIVQRALAYPDRIFIYRYYVRGPVTPGQVFNGLAINNADPRNVWFVGLNENDNFGDDAAALRGRVLWDAELFDRIQQAAPGARYFGGSFGHGAPGGVEDPNGPVADALRGYIPLWKKGMGIDLHNYTKGRRFPDDPPPDAEINAPMWFEDRGDFWFKSVGLDPRAGGGFIHSETGVEAGHGGYSWAGYSQQQFARHIRSLSEIGRSPIVIPSGPNAGTWPSVDVAGAIYQMGNTDTGPNGWAGYNVEGFLSELRMFWAEGR